MKEVSILAVVKLKEVSIIGKLSDIDDIATVCGKTNAFHADNALTQYSDAPDFTSYTEENPLRRTAAATYRRDGQSGKNAYFTK